MAAKIRRDDEVIVLTGKDKGYCPVRQGQGQEGQGPRGYARNRQGHC